MLALPTLQSTLKLLSDPVRLRILALVAREELAVQELQFVTSLAQSRISNHLSLLKRSGLVADRREGTWSFYRLSPPQADGPLSPELFDAVVRPYLESSQGCVDAEAIERVREQRRERSRATHDRLADRWSELGQDFRFGSLRTEAYAALVPTGMRVADLGCGTGYFTTWLAEHGARVIAVDHSSAMIEEARGRVPEGVEFRVGELDQLPLADAEVDAVFANLVWHHLPGMDGAAAEVARVLKPDGTVVVTDLLPHQEEWMREEMGDLRLGLSPQSVVDALSKAGFEDLASEAIHDRYQLAGKSGRKVDFPMFIVRGRRAGTIPG
ncbi:MAG: metalloregulator ArsR/SmtB family transcription factor [Planctomycetota bacterium]|jgi:ArsR family transcriptional regulator|nr:metalloregulator ArsR/SmtB family transcription factor [Planctomycetota bacterium]